MGCCFGLLIAGRADLAAAGIPLIIVPQLYLSGMFRPSSTLPFGVHWLQWCSVLKYGYSALTIIEFGDDAQHFDNVTEWTQEDTQHWKSIHFEQNYIDPENPWNDFMFYTLVPLAMYAALIVLSMIILKVSAIRR